MENNNKEIVIPFGGDCPEIGFNLTEWQKAYLINGSYETRNPDGTIRTVLNDYRNLISNYYRK